MKTTLITLFCAAVLMTGCDDPRTKTSDQRQQEDQERILQEGTSAVGMPAVTNFRERKMMKQILELRDDMHIITYTYVFSQYTGKYTYLGQSFGYGLPYATQFTNPQKEEWINTSGGTGHWRTLPQADPNGLFSPSAAEGTWIMMPNPSTGKPEVQYIEERISTYSYMLPAKLVAVGY